MRWWCLLEKGCWFVEKCDARNALRAFLGDEGHPTTAAADSGYAARKSCGLACNRFGWRSYPARTAAAAEPHVGRHRARIGGRHGDPDFEGNRSKGIRRRTLSRRESEDCFGSVWPASPDRRLLDRSAPHDSRTTSRRRDASRRRRTPHTPLWKSHRSIRGPRSREGSSSCSGRGLHRSQRCLASRGPLRAQPTPLHHTRSRRPAPSPQSGD